MKVMLNLTNVVCSCDLGCRIDLRQLTLSCSNIRYNPKTFSGVIWQHRKIGGNCLIFSNGKISVNGKVRNISDARIRVRRYVKLIRNKGWPVTLKKIKIVTMSAYFQMEGHLNMDMLVRDMGARYEPELFPAAMLKRGSVHFTCFHNGKILLTGIKQELDLSEAVYPTLIELELLST